MYNTKDLRAALLGLIKSAAGTYPVSYAVDATNATRFVVFGLQDMPAIDERAQIELEVNTVGPLSDADNVEAVSDAITAALDRNVTILTGLSFYVYRNTRNRVDGSDPHTVRYRATYDVYLYERN